MAEPDPQTPPVDDDATLSELQEQAEGLGIPKSGTKDELRERIAAEQARLAPVSAAAAEPVDIISTADILADQPARANPTPGPEAQPAKPLATGQKGKAIVRTAWPVDSFDSGVEGVEPITSTGVEVGPSKVDELLAAAASAGTTLEVVS